MTARRLQNDAVLVCGKRVVFAGVLRIRSTHCGVCVFRCFWVASLCAISGFCEKRYYIGECEAPLGYCRKSFLVAFQLPPIGQGLWTWLFINYHSVLFTGLAIFLFISFSAD